MKLDRQQLGEVEEISVGRQDPEPSSHRHRAD
jgi:hypothetical protein